MRVGNTLSDVKITKTGAPQGCVPSPILFTIYTADGRPSSDSVLQIKFADDTSLSGFLWADEVTYRSAVDELVRWCDQNILELNVTKTAEPVIDFRQLTHSSSRAGSASCPSTSTWEQ